VLLGSIISESRQPRAAPPCSVAEPLVDHSELDSDVACWRLELAVETMT
jgi:hypothetical protein